MANFMTDAAIETIDLIPVALPRRREHKWTGATESIGAYLLVKMTDSDGRTGWGEATALKDWAGEFGRYFGESGAIVATVIKDYLAPAVFGGLPGNFVELHDRMDRAIKGYPYAKASVEMAAYDLAARQANLPVYRLLGGAVRKTISVAHSIGLIAFDEAEKEVAQVLEEGIRAIKIKVGVDADRDVEMVRRIRSVIGTRATICIDANQGYATPSDAIRMFRKIESCEIAYFEQPVEGIERLAQVARAIDTPVMADESAWNSHDVLQIIEHRAAQMVSIYTTKPGGLYRAMEVAAVAQAGGLICNVNGSIETGIGNLANLQLAAAAPVVKLPCVVPVSMTAEHRGHRIAGVYYTDDLLMAPIVLKDGAVELPNGIGMGIEPDLQKIARYTVGPAITCTKS
jgi:muconate cycloisomerase